MIPLDAVVAEILTCTAKTPLEPLISYVKLDTGSAYMFTLHPAAESLYLEIDGEYVSISAKTSTVGPGYHAFLISIMDSVQAKLGLKWEWGADDDEAGFAQHRSFELLQSEMAKHLKSLATIVSEQIAERGLTGMMLSMPVDCGIQTFENEILTPVGPVAPAALRLWAGSEGPELMRAAINYFPWWEAGLGGSFYRGLALHSIWTHMRWARPLDDAERRDIERTLAWCGEAERLRADPPVPAAPVSELRALLASPHDGEFPPETGIGYRRRQKLVELTGGWRLWVPGSLEETLEDDNSTVVLWNDALIIRSSSVAARPKGESAAMQAEESGIEIERKFVAAADGNGFTLQVEANKRSAGIERICVLTFWMADASTRGRAEQIAEALFHRE